MLSSKGRAVLSWICPTMLEVALDLTEIRGKRGGHLGYRVGTLTIGPDVVAGLIKSGYIDSDTLKITAAGTLALQDAPLDAA